MLREEREREDRIDMREGDGEDGLWRECEREEIITVGE